MEKPIFKNKETGVQKAEDGPVTNSITFNDEGEKVSKLYALPIYYAKRIIKVTTSNLCESDSWILYEKE